MSIIDCHVHLGRNENVNYSVDQLLLSMDKAKIDKALVFAGEINDCPNEWMLNEIAPYKDRLYGVAAAHPMKAKSLSEIENEAKKISDWYLDGKIVACKFYTGYDHFYPYDPIIKNYLINFSNIGCSVIFHSGDCLNSVKCAKLKYAHPLHIDEVAVDYPDINFVIAHMAYPFVREAAEVCYKNKNVYTDISGFVYGNFNLKDECNFRKVVEEFVDIAGGADKILFGTDAPISNQDSYLDMASKIFPESIFEKNSKKVFRL